MDQAKKAGKPFFVWHNTTRMHVWTFLSPKYKAMMNNQRNYGLEESGMAQMHDSIDGLLKKLDDIGEANTRSSSSPPTMARKSSPGPTAA